MELVKNLYFPLFLVSNLFTSGPKPSKGARVFTIVNYSRETIWPAVYAGENFSGGGFALKNGKSCTFTAPVSWSGRIWGRTSCRFNHSSNG
ncbi:hypothetical protein SASPL_113183 [Salvia splendens]|uniref:Uncharacterized protein n=1 Tax=Salvia splendens TaxID=180675 RepID=A0A8X8ZZA3_SALSN|nr:hypothetical protein SASPL_113183 [Salvia splendens]